MTDRTTDGIQAEPEEVEALLHNLMGFHLADRDPVSRYEVLTREQVLYDALVEAIKRERGRALAELADRGHKLTQIAVLTGLRTRQQVQRLIQVGTDREVAAVAEAQEASRQFEERLAAVEATLDEVVSGIPVNEPTVPVTELIDDYDTVMAKEPYVVEPFDPLTADLDQLTGMLEPTQVMPALSAAMQPTRELTRDEPWWREDPI
jgi:hypothetical protein